MSQRSKWEYFKAIYERYHKAPQALKRIILGNMYFKLKEKIQNRLVWNFLLSFEIHVAEDPPPSTAVAKHPRPVTLFQWPLKTLKPSV